MVRNKYILITLLVFPLMMFAQANTGKYIVYFKDKAECKNVSNLFSPKALEKRKKFNIPFDERDFPVKAEYVEQLIQKNIPVLQHSDWLNAVVISADEKQIELVKKMFFVSSIIKITKGNTTGVASISNEESCESIENTEYEENFSNSYEQFHLLNGDYLHGQGFNGERMTIAMCDEGFNNANNNPGFTHVFSDHRLLGYYDYVDNDSTVFNTGNHGSYCFSFIAGLKANSFIGTSTKSKFYLFRTENGNSERLQEEFNLATALQRCDQLGVDIVSISLGYTTFDVSSENHDTTDMMKNNTPSAIAVNIASSKGILVCVAAGNEGANPAWHVISTPSDADSAFCIASVDVNGVPAPSSGWALAADTRIKPNVAAVGQHPKYLDINGNVVSLSSGTSFATPSLAGMSACLWEAFPSKTNWQIKTAIEQSASQYLNPDKHIGYGIPDFKKAYEILSVANFVSNEKLESEFLVYPNPFKYNIGINNSGSAVINKIDLMNDIGQVIYSDNSFHDNSIALNDLPKGMYTLQIATSNGILIKKLIKD
ncbi:MAG: hypothetical protein JWN78_768 [Bacteroidota bacterium]|nr:hypothetical protein [Bacteroidota bacterium]